MLAIVSEGGRDQELGSALVTVVDVADATRCWKDGDPGESRVLVTPGAYLAIRHAEDRIVMRARQTFDLGATVAGIGARIGCAGGAGASRIAHRLVAAGYAQPVEVVRGAAGAAELEPLRNRAAAILDRETTDGRRKAADDAFIVAVFGAGDIPDIGA